MHSTLVGTVIAVAFSGSRGEEGWCLNWLACAEGVEGHEVCGREW